MTGVADIRLITDKMDSGWPDRLTRMFRSRWNQQCEVTCHYNSLRGMDETHLVFEPTSTGQVESVTSWLKSRLKAQVSEMKLMA